MEVPVERIVEQSVYYENLIEQPVDQYIEVPVPVEKIVEVPVERIIEEEIRVPIEKIVERQIEQIVERPVERIIEVPRYIDNIIEREVPYEKVKIEFFEFSSFLIDRGSSG